MSYSTQRTTTYQYSSGGGPGRSQVTTETTTYSSDGRKETRTHTTTGGDPGNVSSNFGNMSVNSSGGGRFSRTSAPTVEARYSSGWGKSGKSRDSARRGGPPMKLEGKTYADIKAQCVREGRLFEDPDFPATNSSIFYSQSPARRFEWKRPTEICDDPQFILDGASRFDVQQGELGDCWFLAAVAGLCQYKDMFARVIPPDQNFRDGYGGIIRFNFWQYGQWQEVVIDDRLPTYNGRLVFMHSVQMNEFWSPLLEKAYAKLNGSYEALKGGATSEAMEDFTGGVTENFDLRKAPGNLFHIMLKAFQRNSLMGCSIDANPNQLEAELPNGLIMGHAYTITNVTMIDIQTSRTKGKIPMVRVRNPWGNECEWKGSWSDKSPEWKFIPEEDRKEIGLTFSDDGEFWMAYSDFIKNFQKLEICNLGPDSVSEGDQSSKRRWEAKTLEGGWKRKVNAGGCRNYLETFWTNPQYRVKVEDPDEDDEENTGTLIVGLMQKGRRKLRQQEGHDLLTIGYVIYAIKDESQGPLDMRFFKYNASVAKSPNFINTREICGRHKLTPGTYCIIPSTFEPNMTGDYLVRIFSEKPADSSEIDEETGMSDVTPKVQLTDADTKEDMELKEAFRRVSGNDMEIDAYELQEILNAAFKKEFNFGGFSNDTCRSLVAMMDEDSTGKLGYDEFKKLWQSIRLWKTVFKKHDTDRSGNFNSYELRSAFNSAGFKLSNGTFNALVQRYSHRDGKIHFDDFIHVIARMTTMFTVFKQMNNSRGKAEFSLDQFIQTTMYS